MIVGAATMPGRRRSRRHQRHSVWARQDGGGGGAQATLAAQLVSTERPPWPCEAVALGAWRRLASVGIGWQPCADVGRLCHPAGEASCPSSQAGATGPDLGEIVPLQ